MTTENTNEFKRTLRLVEQSEAALEEEPMNLDTVIVRFLRLKNNHALSEFLRCAVKERFIKEALAMVASKTSGVPPLEPSVEEYIKKNLSNGGPQ